MSSVKVPASCRPGILLEIDPQQLVDPIGITEEKLHVGLGSFGILMHHTYRGIHVAIKEMLPKTMLCDIKKEANLMANLCHPSVPHFFGICTSDKPYRIVMQYQPLPSGEVTTLAKALKQDMTFSGMPVVTLCQQLFQGLHYLHESAKILHMI